MNIYHDKQKIRSFINYRRALVFVVYKDKGSLICKTRHFSGIKTIAHVKVANATQYQLELAVSEGKAKVVAVSGHTIIELAETEYFQQKTITLAPGRYRIRVVGIDTGINLTIASV